MADTDNLKIQQQINKLLKERQSLLNSIEEQLSTQTDTSQKFQDILANASKLKLADVFSEATEGADGLKKATKSASDQSTIAGQLIKSSMSGTTSVLSGIGKAFGSVGKGAMVFGGVAMGAASLVTGAFSGVLSIISSVAGVIKSVVGAMWNLAKSIIALPFNLLNGLIEMGNELMGIGLDIARAWEDVRDVFGDLSTTVGADIRSTVMNLRMIGDTGLDAYQVLGTMSQRIEAVSKLYQGLGGAVMLFSQEIKNSNGAVIAFQRGLGFTEEQLQGVATMAMSSGKTLVEVQSEIANQSIQLGATFGIPKKLIGKDVAEMINDIDTFGNMTVKQMAKTSVYAKKLGVDVKKMAGVFKAFSNFEDAAIGAAKLSQAFGMNIDAVKQLKAGSPAEIVEDLRSAFFAAGKDAANLNRHELALLATQSGLDQETAKRVFSLENQGVAYEDIANKADDAESAQLTAANAMKQVAKDIKKIVHEVLKMDGAFAEFRKGFEQGFTIMNPKFMDLIKIARDVGITMRGMGQQFAKAILQLEPVQNIFTGLAKFLTGFTDLLKNVASEFVAWANDIGKAGKNAEQAGARLVDRLGKVLDASMKEGGAMAKGLTMIKNGLLNLGTIILDSLSGIIPRAMQKLTSLLETGVQWMNSPSSITGKLGLGQASSAFLGAFVNLFNKIKDNAGPLWAAVKDFISTAFSKGAEDIENSPFVQKLKLMFRKLGKTIMADMLEGLGEALATFKSSIPGLTDVVQGIGKSLTDGAKIQRVDIQWLDEHQSQLEASRKKGRQEEVKHSKMMNRLLGESGLKGEKLEAAKKKAREASALVGQQVMLKEQAARAKHQLSAAVKGSANMSAIMSQAEAIKDLKAKKAAFGEHGKLNAAQKKDYDSYAMAIQLSTLKINKLKRDHPLAAKRLQDEQSRIANLQTKLKGVTAKLKPYEEFEQGLATSRDTATDQADTTNKIANFYLQPKLKGVTAKLNPYEEFEHGQSRYTATDQADKVAVITKGAENVAKRAANVQQKTKNLNDVITKVNKSIKKADTAAGSFVTTLKPMAKSGVMGANGKLVIQRKDTPVEVSFTINLDAKDIETGLVNIKDGKLQKVTNK